ncbi:MAG: GntR family transcriptional regulator [Planctomycetota bacterium]
MFLHIDAADSTPVYDQIARQVVFAVAGGALAAGDLIPSVRELARELAVNPNTVARAYRELQAQGVVESSPGVGLLVRSGAKRACQRARREALRQRVSSALRATLDAGLDPDEAEALFRAELDKLCHRYQRPGESA